MNIKFIKKISFLLLFFSLPMHSIQRVTAHMTTGIVGTLAAASVCQTWLKTNHKLYTSVIGGCSIVGMYMFSSYLYSITPEGRLKAASKIIDTLSQHTLIRHEFPTDELLFNAINDVFLTEDLPLISAYNHFLSLLPLVHEVFSIINKASAEIRKDLFLQEECNSAMAEAQDIFNHLSDMIKRVRNHKDYLAQLQIYKEFLMTEKKIAVHTQIARAKESSVLLKWVNWFCT